MEFQGKVVLVTGGASGIGFATCRGFAEAGALVLLTDVDAEKAEQAAAELRSVGGLTERVSAETLAAQIRTTSACRRPGTSIPCQGRRLVSRARSGVGVRDEIDLLYQDASPNRGSRACARRAMLTARTW